MARTASLVYPLPLASMNRRAMMRVRWAIPVTPTPLFPVAPMVPATWVPWPLSSIGLASLLLKSYPCRPLVAPSMVFVHMFAAKSGWL